MDNGLPPALDRWAMANPLHVADSDPMIRQSGRYPRAAMNPLIGVSTSEMREAARANRLAEADPPMRELALGLAYPRAVEQCGGIPVVIPPLDRRGVDALLGRLSGLVISGGPDIHPLAYDAEPHPALGPTEPDLDAFEIALVRRALKRGIPILALCRGLQVLNVACGGTLIQDLPDQLPSDLNHRQTERGEVTTHAVDVQDGTLLASVFGSGEHAVNSFHHQAVETLGRGLRAVAWAPDDVVEAIEFPGATFALGVQWHAESLVDRDDHAGLFSGLVDAAARYETSRVRTAA